MEMVEKGHQNAAKQAVLMRDFTTVVKRYVAQHGDDKDWQIAMPNIDCEASSARWNTDGL